MMFVTSWLVVRNGILSVKNEKIKIEIVFVGSFSWPCYRAKNVWPATKSRWLPHSLVRLISTVKWKSTKIEVKTNRCMIYKTSNIIVIMYLTLSGEYSLNSQYTDSMPLFDPTTGCANGDKSVIISSSYITIIFFKNSLSLFSFQSCCDCWK